MHNSTMKSKQIFYLPLLALSSFQQAVWWERNITNLKRLRVLLTGKPLPQILAPGEMV